MLKLLFVDDEPKILDGLRRSLRPFRHEWTPEFANGAAEALRLLETEDFDVLVTDMRMPGMDGLELLRQVTAHHPHLLRIVLSGQSDLENFVRSSGVTHHYLSKPCSVDDLRLAVTRVCERAALADRR